MILSLVNGNFDTQTLAKNVNDNIINVEKASRSNPCDAVKYPIGYVLPLGTLGNAPNQPTQFKSNFHLIAYTITNDIIDKKYDFEDFNIESGKYENTHLARVNKELDDIAKVTFGDGWHITIFNVSINTALESMCKGSNNVDAMKKSAGDLCTIVKNRINALNSSTETNPWKHELIQLIYAPLRAISINFTKYIEPRSRNEKTPTGICNSMVFEALVYDHYANGLRLLSNIESFASTKIRQYSSDKDDTYLFVLKAKVQNEEDEFIPVRQFCGKSTVSNTPLQSGCSERIIYNIVNKNYKHWSFMSIPSTLKMSLNDVSFEQCN